MLNQPLLQDTGGQQSQLKTSIEHMDKFTNVKHVQDIKTYEGKFPRVIFLLTCLLSINGYTGAWLKSSILRARVRQLLAENSYDVIHLDTISLHFLYDLLADHKVVLDHHNVESDMMMRRSKKESNIFKSIYFLIEAFKIRRLEKKFCSISDLNITCSILDRQRLLEVASTADIVSIPNAIELCRLSTTYLERRNKSRLSFIGTMNWYPNIEAVEFILDNLALPLSQSNSNITIDIVGAHATKPIVKKSKIHNNVNLHGFVDDLSEIQSETIIFICPIKDGGGTKLKILEAMSMGIPVIADPVACEGIAVEDRNNVYFASTAEEYLEGLDLLLSNDELRVSIGRGGAELIEKNYTVDVVGVKLLNTYQGLAVNVRN